MNYIVKRELVDSINNGYKLLVISNNNQLVLAESEGFSSENEDIRLKYEDLEYVYHNNEILLTLESILNKFKK